MLWNKLLSDIRSTSMYVRTRSSLVNCGVALEWRRLRILVASGTLTRSEPSPFFYPAFPWRDHDLFPIRPNIACNVAMALISIFYLLDQIRPLAEAGTAHLNLSAY